jgi:hypothetical protein
VHCAGADLDVDRHLDHAAPLRPEILQAQDEILERDSRHCADYMARFAR